MKQKSLLYLFSAFFFLCCLFFLNGANATFGATNGTLIDDLANMGSLNNILGPNGASMGNASPMTLSLDKTTPDPFAQVTATVNSLQFNVNATNITWYVNNTIRSKGLGIRTFTFTMGGVGEPITVKAEAVTTEYGIVTQEITLTPGGVDILWEADTYVPPFYKGKPLPSAQSRLKAVAFPSFVSKGTTIPKESLIYVWKKGYENDTDASGAGKYFYAFDAGYPFSTSNMEVSVSSLDNAIKATKFFNVYVAGPKILFYQNKPLEGVRYEQQLGDRFLIPDKEVIVRAEPYFFSFVLRNKNDGYWNWKLDSKKLQVDPDNISEYVIRAPETGSGSVSLQLNILNQQHVFQEISKSVTLSYFNQ